jgi:hypothetical protein
MCMIVCVSWVYVYGLVLQLSMCMILRMSYVIVAVQMIGMAFGIECSVRSLRLAQG